MTRRRTPARTGTGAGSGAAGSAPAVYRITVARRPHSDDQHQRVVKYLVSMTIRAVCIALALVVSGPLQWVFIAGAVLLPWVAVVIANAGGDVADPPPDTWAGVALGGELPGPRQSGDAPGAAGPAGSPGADRAI